MTIHKKQVELPSWLLRAGREYSDSLPIDNPELTILLTEPRKFFEEFVVIYNALPTSETYQVMSSESFERLNPALLVPQLFKDFSQTTYLLRSLSFYRCADLINSYIRAARTQDYISMAVVSRSILELGLVVVDSSRDSFGMLNQIKDTPSNAIVSLDAKWIEKFKKVETDLNKSIFGTRIGTGHIGGSKKTPLWEETPMDGGFLAAKNIMSSFQGRAKRMADGTGTSDMKVYELLCDVVHPSALGYQMLFASGEVKDGYHRYGLQKGKGSKDVNEYVAAASLYCATHGIGYLVEHSRNLENIQPDLEVALSNIKVTFDAV